MERKHSPLPLPEKLTTAAAIDYPTASDIIVSFPEDCQLVDVFRRAETPPLYVAGMPHSIERSRSDHFYGLPPEINHSLTTHRLYKLFVPRPVPLFNVAWNSYLGEGRIIGGAGLQVHLHPVGQAQIWQGETYAVLWECYGFEPLYQRPHWQEELAQFWQAVENDMKVNTLFTQPLEPAFEEGYTEFLSGLGYAPDPEFERWWRKDWKVE